MAALLAAVLAAGYGASLPDAFTAGDYIILDKTRGASFLSLWAPDRLTDHWYPPWSRELHFWTLQSLFGARQLPFHLASLALALGALVAYYALARRVAGAAAAAVSVAGAASLAALGLPVVWAAGAQDLWMLLWALLALVAWARGRVAFATVAFTLALISKETAAVLPAIAVAYALLVERRALMDALRRSAPLWLAAAGWAGLHLVLGGRLWPPPAQSLEWGRVLPPHQVGIKTILTVINLDQWPRPESGWPRVLLAALPAAAVLAVLVVVARRAMSAERAPRIPASDAPAPMRRAVAFGCVWALLGWLPLFMTALTWQPHDSLLGALGAWLSLGVALARRGRLAATLIAAVALLGPARAATPGFDWGSAWYHRRAAEFLSPMRASLLRLHPRFPSHSRLYFVLVPSRVGILDGDAPALRVWYADSTLRAFYYPRYRPRAAGEPRGNDYFFRFDAPSAGWIEVVKGPEDVTAARAANPRWQRDHVNLAATLIRAADWPGAAQEYAKLAAFAPDGAEFAFNAGVCAEALGDSAAAARWYARAAALPDADEQVKQAAREFRRFAADSGR